jgi:hypothetical protein
MVKPEQLLLLHAIIEKSDRSALDYFTEWDRSSDNMDQVEGDTFRVLPLLYKRLSKTGRSIHQLNRLKGIYRLSWYRNTLLFHKALQVLAELEQMSVPVILLKGIALVTAYYEDIGARLMKDVDFLVREEDFDKTLRFLKKKGWKSKYGVLLSKPAKHIHSVDLTNQEGCDLDVHWRAFYQCPWDGADDSLWENTEELVFQGLAIRILNPTQQILHICAHGVQWNEISSIRWIVDVIKILERRSNSVDWQLLVSESSARNLCLTMLHTLSYLKSEFQTDIPDDVLESLKKVPKNVQEIHLFNVLTSPPSLGNIIRKKWLIHSSSMGKACFWKKAFLFPGFLRNDFYQEASFVRDRIKKWLIRRPSI